MLLILRIEHKRTKDLSMTYRLSLTLLMIAMTTLADEAKDNTSYTIGYRMGSSLQPVKDEINIDALMEGITAGMNGTKPKLSAAEMNQLTQALSAKAQAASEAQQAGAGKENLATGLAFLAENGKAEGWTTTASGLQYKVLTAAEGPKPKATDTVSVHYAGTLLDGSEFDSSYKRDEPASFPLNGVIKGWTEGVQLMSVGAKYRFAIHPDMAYGPGGRPGIPPNSVLLFDVELLEIK
ncbi:MAG TPA: peptidylprolyl isomerase [Lentisphaeria bacterium]|nr:peptidylprolyl isomerase [Lentisphaeria bacterium]